MENKRILRCLEKTLESIEDENKEKFEKLFENLKNALKENKK